VIIRIVFIKIFMMYAIACVKGRQYRCSPGQTVTMDFQCEKQVGQIVSFKDVAVVATQDSQGVLIGAPYVEGASVTVRIVQHIKGKKISMICLKRRKHHMKKKGFRSRLTTVKVLGVTIDQAS
jgi:large subunit ribosomal protein L21